MHKRIISLAMALILTLALVPSAFAAETVSNGFFTLTNTVWKEEWDTPYDEETREVLGLAGAEYIVSEGAVLTFANATEVRYQQILNPSYKGGKLSFSWRGGYEGMYADWLDAQKTFSLETNAAYTFSYGEGADTKAIKIFVVDNSIAANYTNEPVTSAPSGKTATPTASTVYVNGNATAFEAYTIDGNNYFKLRDLAAVLNGTGKQFGVGYDNDTKAITLTSGNPYTSVGGELVQGDGTAKTATPTASKIYLDENELNLTVYTINGNNFFKLRDLMQAINVYVGYDNATKNITLDTSNGYVD